MGIGDQPSGSFGWGSPHRVVRLPLAVRRWPVAPILVWHVHTDAKEVEIMTEPRGTEDQNPPVAQDEDTDHTATDTSEKKTKRNGDDPRPQPRISVN